MLSTTTKLIENQLSQALPVMNSKTTNLHTWRPFMWIAAACFHTRRAGTWVYSRFGRASPPSPHTHTLYFWHGWFASLAAAQLVNINALCRSDRDRSWHVVTLWWKALRDDVAGGFLLSTERWKAGCVFCDLCEFAAAYLVILSLHCLLFTLFCRVLLPFYVSDGASPNLPSIHKETSIGF